MKHSSSYSRERVSYYRTHSRELVHVPPRHLDDAVVEAGLEAGSCASIRDDVRQFGQAVTQTELRGDVGQRVTGRLASQRGAPRQPRVHLDDVVGERLRVQRELNVAFAHYAQMAGHLCVRRWVGG